MTHEEKAKELVEMFAETIPPKIFGQLMERDWYTARQCALICVDEIIKEIPMYTGHYTGHLNPKWTYLEQVKQAIINYD